MKSRQIYNAAEVRKLIARHLQMFNITTYRLCKNLGINDANVNAFMRNRSQHIPLPLLKHFALSKVTVYKRGHNKK